LNKYLEIIVILAFLSIILFSLKLAHGQSNNLTMNQTNGLAYNQTEAYRDTLMDVSPHDSPVCQFNLKGPETIIFKVDK